LPVQKNSTAAHNPFFNNGGFMSHHGRNIAKSAAKKSTTKKPTKAADPHVAEIARTEATRPITAGAGKQRGDRRDMSPTYTNNQKHRARGNTPRKDVKTRAR
jgi:hypothetical protein